MRRHWPLLLLLLLLLRLDCRRAERGGNDSDAPATIATATATATEAARDAGALPRRVLRRVDEDVEVGGRRGPGVGGSLGGEKEAGDWAAEVGGLLDAVRHVWRRLKGSNCVQVELGQVSKYYTCTGCVMEEAMGCIEDMRQNKSGNVAGGCNMNWAREGNQKQPMEAAQQAACCPMFSGGKLQYQQSAFNYALQCIQNAGCSSSTVYNDLLKECSHMCDRVDSKTHAANSAANKGDNAWYDDDDKQPKQVAQGFAAFSVSSSVCSPQANAGATTGRLDVVLASAAAAGLALVLM